MTREVIKTTTETRGRGALMQWEQSEQWWLSCSHTHTHTGWPVCGWATFDPSWEQSNTSLSHSPLFNPSSFSPSHTHTCRASVVRVREWPRSTEAWLWGLITHTYCLALWASIAPKLTAWKTLNKVFRDGGNSGKQKEEKLLQAKTPDMQLRLMIHKSDCHVNYLWHSAAHTHTHTQGSPVV